MNLTEFQRDKIRITLQISLIGAVLGIVYIFFAHGTSRIYPFINGLVIGGSAGATIAILEVYVFARNAKRIKFIWFFIIRLNVYVVLLVLILFNFTLFSQMTRLGMTYSEVLSSDKFNFYLEHGTFKIEVVYIIVLGVIVNFTRIMSIKMGQGMLKNYIRGTYTSPIEEDRIFMFIKVKNANDHLQTIGPMKFHKFLNQLYSDFSEPVVSNKGVIHEYVEDLMVVTWKTNTQNADNSLKMFYEIDALINLKKEEYISKFGFAPEMQAAIHNGTVVCTEIGEIKTQIVFHGDVMNSTSRILSQCIDLDRELMISDKIKYLIRHNEYSIKVEGEFQLKGKLNKMFLYSFSTQSAHE